jgi:hypothetical protein
MAIKFSDLDIQTKLPVVPASVPVYALTAPTLDERRAAINGLGEQLKLGTLRAVELEHGIVMASESGDITYFHASGAISARDATAGKGAVDEFRKWSGLVETTTDGYRVALNADMSKRLIAQAQDLLKPLGLLGAEMASASVQLEQVAQLDEKGREIAHGAGQATVKFAYAVEGLPVRGAGAKTLAFAEPASGGARIGGTFHAWRTVGKGAPIKMQALEAALGVGLLSDPELNRYANAGHKIQITRLDFVLAALPAFMRQSHLFPAFQVEGVVSAGDLGISFHFARFHHAAPPSAYAAAGIYGPYLTVNPDGINPLPAKKQLM